MQLIICPLFIRNSNNALIGILLLAFSNVYAQQNPTGDYYTPNHLRYSDYIYVPHIRTAQLYPEGNDLLPPILELGKSQQLVLHFDDLEGGVKSYYYTFIHCEADWQPSSKLLTTQYISGFQEDKIYDYKFSFSTFQKYTHYRIAFPNENIQPTLSGNYILKVYAEGNADKPIITRRFLIADPQVAIEVNIHRATVVDDYNTHQEIDFKILNPLYNIDDPFNALKVVICQNNRWDNAISNLKPMFVKTGELAYDYDRGNTFTGGNEFRSFDTRTLKFKTERVEDIYIDSLNHYQVMLLPDGARRSQYYSTQPDLNGWYSIKLRDELTDSNVECDYTYVHFNLPTAAPFAEGNLYILGQLSNWSFAPENKMRYNPQTKAYEAMLLLKQGYYNYEYVLARAANQGIDENFIEGSHSETENNYTIYVYNRPMGSLYDHLIGITQVKSR